eukprot:1849828-Pyramimonas_sp.AAC.1
MSTEAESLTGGGARAGGGGAGEGRRGAVGGGGGGAHAAGGGGESAQSVARARARHGGKDAALQPGGRHQPQAVNDTVLYYSVLRKVALSDYRCSGKWRRSWRRHVRRPAAAAIGWPGSRPRRCA